MEIYNNFRISVENISPHVRLAELNKSGIFKKWKRDASPPVKVCSRSPEEILVKDKLKYNSIRVSLVFVKEEMNHIRNEKWKH